VCVCVCVCVWVGVGGCVCGGWVGGCVCGCVCMCVCACHASRCRTCRWSKECESPRHCLLSLFFFFSSLHLNVSVCTLARVCMYRTLQLASNRVSANTRSARKPSPIQKRQQGLNTFITKIVRDARCSKLKLMQQFFFGESSGRGASKVDYRCVRWRVFGAQSLPTRAAFKRCDCDSILAIGTGQAQAGTTTFLLLTLTRCSLNIVVSLLASLADRLCLALLTTSSSHVP
jgi:hypothetical protein